MGAQGPAGPAGTQTAAAKNWSSFRDFLFDFDQASIRHNEEKKVADIAAHLQQNPTHTVGIDGYTDPRGSNAYNQTLSQRRVNAVRNALIQAGVLPNKILTGAFGENRANCQAETEACWQHNRRVEVLIGIKLASR